MRRVVLDSGRFVVGRVRRRHAVGELRLIVDRFEPVPGIPSGNRLPAYHDWAVLTCTRRGQPQVAQLPAIVHASPSQLVVCLCLDSKYHERIQAIVWNGGKLVSVTTLRIVGSGGFELPEPEHDDPFDITPDRREFLALRESRTLGALRNLLPTRIRPRCIVNVGAGGGGSSLAVQLAALGRPRRMLLFDGDRIGPENLNALPHAAEADARDQALKVEILAAALEANQPDLHVNGLPWPITEGRSIQMLENTRVDAFFSFVDNDAARLCTNQLAREAHAVHIDVGTLIRWDGDERIMHADIRLFEPGHGRGCVFCVPQMPAKQRDEAIYELNAPPNSLHRGEPFAWDDETQGRAGSLYLLNSLASSVAVDLWLAWLDGRIETSHWIRVNWRFGDVPRFEAANVRGVSQCQLCGDEK